MEGLTSVKPAVTDPAQHAPEPFRFSTCLMLSEATGLRAATLPQLLRLLREVPDSCIYFHTHYFLLAHHYLTPEPTNDFAYWVTEVLGEGPLGELLAGVDTMQYHSLQGLREALIQAVAGYLKQYPLSRFKFASEGEEFFFVKSVRVILPTPISATNFEEFVGALPHASLHSLYFHIFDARLRLGRPTNDFAVWLEEQLQAPALAKDVAALDPYAHSLDTLRSMIIALVRNHLVAAVADVEPR